MGIITKEVEVKLWGNNIKHYHDLGYFGKQGDIITVKVEDLTHGAEAKIDVLCDYCQENIFSMKYYVYQYRIKDIPKCACSKCKGLKMKEINMLKHGIPWVTHTEEAEIRRKKTMEEKYGTTNFWEIPEMKQKYMDTCTERYGAPFYTQTEEFKEKFMGTSRKKYGTDYPWQSKKVQEKIRAVVNEKYGVDNVMLNKEICERSRATMYMNGTCPTSKQQIFLHNLYGGRIKLSIKNVQFRYLSSR